MKDDTANILLEYKETIEKLEKEKERLKGALQERKKRLAEELGVNEASLEKVIEYAKSKVKEIDKKMKQRNNLLNELLEKIEELYNDDES